MRVLHVICGLDHVTGGPAVAVAGLAAAQQAAGLSVSVLNTNWAGHSGDEPAAGLAEAGVHVEQIGPCRKPFARHPQIRPSLERLVPQADVVHIHGLWEQVQHHAARIARACGIPYLFSPHGMLDRWSLRSSRWAKQAYLALRLGRHLRRAAAVHYVTDWEQQQVCDLGLQTPAIVEPIGLDLAEFRSLPAAGLLRGRFGQIQDRPLVLFLGRVHPAKGVEHLLAAWPLLRNTQAILVVAGPDTEGFASQMQRLAASWGLADRVLFAGMLHGRERLAALVDADLFALPSEHENFSVATAEALACGKPVVVSDQVGLGSLVVQQQLGSSVRLEQGATALAAELDAWLADGPRRIATGRRAREFALRYFDWDGIAARWIEHYARLVRPAAREVSDAARLHGHAG